MSFISLRPDAISSVLRAPLAIVIPVCNEGATILSVVLEWIQALTRLGIDFQFILINDGSNDNTLGVLREMEASSPERFVTVDKPNAGHGRSCRLGYDPAVGASAVEWILQIDSDGQCDPSYFDHIVVSLFVIGIVSTTLIGVARTTPLIQYYGGTRNLNRFYQEFRQTVLGTCPRSARVYLELNGQHQKFRQMAVYYLPEREVASDWMDDVYIFFHLPLDHRKQALNAGDCVVELIAQDGGLSQGSTVGPFRIGMLNGQQGRVRIASVIGAYARETDDNNWWHWVERKVNFILQPLFVSKNATQVKLSFEYGTLGNQTLTLRFTLRDGSRREVLLRGKGYPPTTFEQVIDLAPADFIEFSIETDGNASRL